MVVPTAAGREGDAAFDTVVTDTLPANDGLAWTIDPANEDCVIEDGVLTCDFGTVAASASASVTIVSPTTLDTCGEVANAASASFSNHDDREAEATVTVLCSDTALTKVADAESVMAGEDIGFTITLMGCYHGFNSKGGAQGVGKATTNAVATSMILILILDYIITELFFAR